jgi:hypothetical protein
VQPHPGDVTWARGQLPTPHGPLQVSWTHHGHAFLVTVDAPHGTSGTVTLPSGRTVHLAAGRHTVVDAGAGN